MKILVTSHFKVLNGIFNVGFNNINLDDANFYEDDLKTIFHVRLFAWHNRLKQRKAPKKEISKELMSVAWHLTRWWDWCVPDDKRKK